MNQMLAGFFIAPKAIIWIAFIKCIVNPSLQGLIDGDQCGTVYVTRDGE